MPLDVLDCFPWLQGQLTEDFDFSSMSFVDDVVLPVQLTAAELLTKVRLAWGAIFDTFREFGFEVNLKKGKSETLIQYAGEGSKQLREHISIDLGMQIVFGCSKGQFHCVHVVHEYKHVGSRASCSGSMLHEIHFRTRDMQVACNSLRAKFLKSPSIPFPRKRLAVQALVMSRGLYNSGTWPCLQ